MASISALDEVVLKFVEGGRVLDVGCGRGKWGHLVKIYWSWKRSSSSNSKVPMVVGVDISQENLEYAKKVYDDIIICDAVYLPFRNRCFDTVIASEVIEHIPYSKGLMLIIECERVARNVVIITTPPPRTVFLSPEHISSWRPSDFRKLGYKVYGVRCYPRFASNNILVQLLIAFVIGPLSYWFPKLSSDMVAVKYINETLDRP